MPGAWRICSAPWPSISPRVPPGPIPRATVHLGHPAPGRGRKAAFAKAVERDVAFVPGEHFFADLSGKNTLRLNFSASTPEEIDRGMRVLGEVFSQMS